MRALFFNLIILFTCVGNSLAQVIQYEIDPSFNSELLLNRGSVSGILIHDDGSFLVTGFLNNSNSIAQQTSLFSNSGGLITPVSGANLNKLDFFLNECIHYGSTGVQRFRLSLDAVEQFKF